MLYGYCFLGFLSLFWGLVHGSDLCTIAQAAQPPPGVELAAVQSLVINNGVVVKTLDPHKSSGAPEANVMRDLFEGLLNFDSQGQLIPGVAIRWQHSADLQQWNFHLRPEAKWSNGDPVTAEDFVYSWRRLADPQTHSPNASYLNDLQLLNSEAVIQGEKPPAALGIQALDHHTLQLHLSQPLPFLLLMLADTALYPLHQATVEHQGYDGKAGYALNHFVGNGAYRLKEGLANEPLVLIRNPNYWDHQNTIIEQVTYLAVVDEIRAIQQYQAGKIDISHTLFPVENYQALRHSLSDEMWCFADYSVYGYYFNTQKVPFNDLRVRQALALVIDQEAMVSHCLAQGKQAAFTLNPPTMQGVKANPPEWTTWPMDRRVAKAKELLQAVGYHQHYPLRFTLLYNTSERHRELALAVSDRWQRILGAEVTLECQEWTAYLASCRKGQYQAARFGLRAVYPHPAALLNLLRSNSSFNDVFYKNPVFDHWLEQALQAITAAERADCYQQAEQLLVQDVPLLPIFHGAQNRLVKPYVGGLNSGPTPSPMYTKDLYLIQHPPAPPLLPVT